MQPNHRCSFTRVKVIKGTGWSSGCWSWCWAVPPYHYRESQKNSVKSICLLHRSVFVSLLKVSPHTCVTLLSLHILFCLIVITNEARCLHFSRFIRSLEVRCSSSKFVPFQGCFQAGVSHIMSFRISPLVYEKSVRVLLVLHWIYRSVWGEQTPVSSTAWRWLQSEF